MWDLEMLREQQEMIERECRLKYELHLRREQDARLAQEQVPAFRRHSHLSSPHAHSCSPLLLPVREATAGSVTAVSECATNEGPCVWHAAGRSTSQTPDTE